MREVSVHWGRQRLTSAKLGILFDFVEEMAFLGYVERNRNHIDVIVQCVFTEGNGPDDLHNLIAGVSVIETLSGPTSEWTNEWVLKLRFEASNNDLIGIQLQAESASVQPETVFNQNGFTYVIRGPANAIKSVITALRLILTPDRMAASSIQPASVVENKLVSPQQLKVVKGAWDAGWYENPRALKMSELSRELNLSRSTVSEHLARVETEMIRLLLEAVSDKLVENSQVVFDLVEFWSNLHPSDFETVRKVVDQGKEDGKPYIVTYRLKLMDGRYKLIRSHSQPQYDEKGKYLGVVGQFEDLSQNKAMGHIMELSINIANSKYSEGLENIPQSGSWEWNVISGKVSWTPALFPLYGCDAETFTPSLDSFTDLIHPEDIEFVMNTIDDALQTVSALDYVHRIVRPSDGEVRTFRCIGGVLTDELGTPTKVIGIAQDITEFKSANLAFQETLAEMKDDLHTWGSFEVNDESKTVTISEAARRMLRD